MIYCIKQLTENVGNFLPGGIFGRLSFLYKNKPVHITVPAITVFCALAVQALLF